MLVSVFRVKFQKYGRNMVQKRINKSEMTFKNATEISGGKEVNFSSYLPSPGFF